MHVVIVGGSDAGVSAGLRAREVAPEAEVTLVVADAFANYSICGLPFFLSGEVSDWRSLAHRTLAELENAGLRVLLNTTATRIEPTRKVVEVQDRAGAKGELAYDRLIIGTGARSIRSQIPGIDTTGVFPLHTMADSFAIDEHVRKQQCSSALVVGGGYIGLEMADALRTRGLEVTLVELAPTVLQTVDASLGQRVQVELERRGVRVCTNTKVERIDSGPDGLAVAGAPDLRLQADLVVVALGVTPDTALAREAGVHLGPRGAIQVSRRMETNVADIYAAGDCVETWHRQLGTTYIPLGTTAHKQGRVAGENALGGTRDFAGSLGTQVVKVFDLVAARTGLRHDEAERAGLAPFTNEFTCWDHKAYYPGAHEVLIRLTGDRNTRALLGAQMLGHVGSEIGKRIDVFASALFHESRVEELLELDLSYTPPFSSPWDPVQMSANAWLRLRESLS